MNTTTTNTSTLMSTADPTQQPYEVVRFNALKHGILSRYTVLIRAAGGVAFVARDLRDVLRELNQSKGQTA